MGMRRFWPLGLLGPIQPPQMLFWVVLEPCCHYYIAIINFRDFPVMEKLWERAIASFNSRALNSVILRVGFDFGHYPLGVAGGINCQDGFSQSVRNRWHAMTLGQAGIALNPASPVQDSLEAVCH